MSALSLDSWSPTAAQLVNYNFGGCWPLALALHKVTGLPFAVLCEDHYSLEYGTSQELVQHVMLSMGSGSYLDINGICTLAEIVERLDEEGVDASDWHVRAASEGFLRSTAREKGEDGYTVLSLLSHYPHAPQVARLISGKFRAEIEAALEVFRMQGTGVPAVGMRVP